MKRKTIKKSITKKKVKKTVKKSKPREGMDIRRMVVRAAIRQGFRVVELGGLAIVGMLMGLKIGF